MPGSAKRRRGGVFVLVALGLVLAVLVVVAVVTLRWLGSPRQVDESVVLALSQVGNAVPPPQPAASAASAAASKAKRVAASEPVDPACPPQWRALAGKPRDALDQVFRQLRPAALAHAGQLLAASPDAFERIAGRLLASRALNQEEPPNAADYLALVSEALASPDPRISALAIQLCEAAPPEHAAACSSISPTRWAGIDPDNLHAWLALLSEALERGDQRSARDALGRAAQSRASRSLWNDAVKLPSSPALQGLGAVERQVLALDLVTVNGLLMTNGMQAASRMCSVDAVEAPARRDECSALAGLLIDQGETMFEHTIGIGLARRVGWPAERLDALTEESQALGEAFAEETRFDFGEDTGKPLTVAEACEAYRHAEAALALVRSGSEMDVARRALERQRAASSPN